MRNKSVFNAKQKNVVKSLCEYLALSVYAEEGEKGDEGGSNNPTVPKKPEKSPIDFEQMIAQARKEEKDKLYPRISALENEAKTHTTQMNKVLLENATLKAEIEKLQASGDSEEVTTLKTKITTLEGEINTLKENAIDEGAVRAKVAAEFEVKLYAKDKIAENKDAILTFLHSDIVGATNEEIDAAIAQAIEKTNSIKKDLGIDDTKKGKPSGKEEGDEDKGEGEPKPSKKKVPPIAINKLQEDEKFDLEHIKNLDPSSEEYKEFRKKIGLK